MITDQQLLNELQINVVEPPNNGASWPTGLWDPIELGGYLRDAQAAFLRDTLAVLTQVTLNTTPQVTRQALPADWLRTVRLVWVTPSGTIYPLERTSLPELDYALNTWDRDTAIPLVFDDRDTPTVEVLIAPASTDVGYLGLIYAAGPTPVNNTGLPLTTPDDALPAIKYHVLARMLGKLGRAHDPDRAAYCLVRYQEVVEAVVAQLVGWETAT